MRRPEVFFAAQKWDELRGISRLNSEFKAFALLSKRGQRYPCLVVDYKEIAVRHVRMGVFRFPGTPYPVGTVVRNCGNMIMQNEPPVLTYHFAYWMGREQTNLVILMQNRTDPLNYEAYWVDNETDGEFVPVKIKMLNEV